MDKVEDVERLFSWLKAPMVHYREFAPQREVADAVATWPAAHRAAVQTGAAAENEPAPRGDSAAKERIARDSRPLPSAAAVQQTPPAAETAAAAAAAETTPGRRSDVGAAGAEHPALHAAAEPAGGANEPIMSGFEDPPPRQAPAGPAEPRPEADEPTRHYPAPERGALFAGEYRGRERDPRSASRVADRQDRSLDAVFSRLSGTRDRLPDPRTRARTSPGLGPVFGRLR